MSQAHSLPGMTGQKAATTVPVPVLIFIFTICFFIFVVFPSFLSQQFSPYPLMKVEDVFALLSPLVLIPLYWIFLSKVSVDPVKPSVAILFLVLGVLWVDGHGIHLAANSISHLPEDLQDSQARVLTYFYDEVLGHYLRDFAVMGFSVLVVACEWQRPPSARFSPWVPVIAGVLHGLTYFLIVIEGQTTLIGIPFAALFFLSGLFLGKNRIRQQPALAFFLIAYLVASLLFAGWWI